MKYGWVVHSLTDLREILVLRLRRIARLGDHLLRGQRGDGDHQRGGQEKRPHRGDLLRLQTFCSGGRRRL